MENYFLIHGITGNPNANWFPWLTNKLVEQGKNVVVPCFPIDENCNYDNWSKILKCYLDLKLINENSVFICHGTAACFIAKFLIKNKIEIKSLITVSGFNSALNNEKDKKIASFLLDNQTLLKLDKYVKYVYCIYSDNDPYISRDYLEDFIFKVKGGKALVNGAGHFNMDSNYSEFPEIVEAIKKMEKAAFKKELL